MKMKLNKILCIPVALMMLLAVTVVPTIAYSPSTATGNIDNSMTTSQNATNNQDAIIQSITHDLAIGKIKAPPVAIDCSNETPKYKPTPILATKPTNGTIIVPMDSSGISAGYQCFGGVGKPDYAGEITGITSSIPNLLDSVEEYAVFHEWGWVRAQYNENENAIAISRTGSTATFSITIQALGGYKDWWSRPASHTFYVQLMPMISSGTAYTQINIFIWDITTNEYFSKAYYLPNIEHIDSVDAALEQPTQYAPNSQWFTFYQVQVYNEHSTLINLQNNFYWVEWSFPQMHNVHSESYQNTPNGPNTQATLSQKKTP